MPRAFAGGRARAAGWDAGGRGCGWGLCPTQALLMNWRGQCPSRLMSSSMMKTKLKAMLRSSAISPSRVVDLRDGGPRGESVREASWAPLELTEEYGA